MVNSSKKSSPTKVSQEDFEIRNKALDLLNRMKSETDDETVGVSYEQEKKKEALPFKQQTFSSYQDASNTEYLDREREAFRQHQEEETWVGALLPLVSCVSEACKVGLTGIAQQTAAGLKLMKDEVVSSTSSFGRGDEIRGTFQAVGIGSSYQSKYSDIPNTTGQHTSEEQVLSA